MRSRLSKALYWLCLESKSGVSGFKTKLDTATVSQKPEPKSKGTVMSDKNRKKANTLSAEERHELMGKALELIYRGGSAKACAPRR